MSEGVAWNQGEVSEETRKLILDAGNTKYQKAVMNILDDIARPTHIPRQYRDECLPVKNLTLSLFLLLSIWIWQHL